MKPSSNTMRPGQGQDTVEKDYRSRKIGIEEKDGVEIVEIEEKEGDNEEKKVWKSKKRRCANRRKR